MKGQKPQNQKIREHNKKMSDQHVYQKSAFKKLFDHDIEIDYKDPKIMKLICHGVPSAYRSKIWLSLIENIHGITHKLYEILIKKAALFIEADPNSVIPQRNRIITHLNRIESDIERTYPQLKIFLKDSEPGQYLFNILSAWTVFREDVGYIQGMSQIAGLLLLELQIKQIQAFTLFCSIMTNDTIFLYENMSIQDIQFFEHSFDKRLKKGDEQFYFRLKNNGIETRTYLLGWILTLFTRTMSLDMVTKLWDILFVFSLSQDILLETAYFLMEAFKIRYGKDVDPGEVNGLLKNFKLTDIEADSLICKLRESYRVS